MIWNTSSSCKVVLVHVGEDRQYSAYTIIYSYIDALASGLGHKVPIYLVYYQK